MSQLQKFANLRQQVVEELNRRSVLDSFPKDPKGFTIIEGFIFQPLLQQIGGELMLGGPQIPTVGIVGNSTGQLYYFPLKALLPSVEI